MREGLVHIYTGNGKGKTTCALGLAFRAIGHQKKVKLVRFMKGGSSGELAAAALVGEWMQYDQINRFGKPVFALTAEENVLLAQATQLAFRQLTESVQKGEFDLYILDEIFASLKREQLTLEQVQELLATKAPHVELVLTGRDAPGELRSLADYVTVMHKEAHPFDRMIPAREGIEY